MVFRQLLCCTWKRLFIFSTRSSISKIKNHRSLEQVGWHSTSQSTKWCQHQHHFVVELKIFATAASSIFILTSNLIECINLKFTLDYMPFIAKCLTVKFIKNGAVNNKHIFGCRYFTYVDFCLQKFRFCGDCDCPDWVLAEIHSSLSMLTSVKLKILTQLVAGSILSEDIPVWRKTAHYIVNSLMSMFRFFPCKYKKIFIQIRLQEAKLKSSFMTNKSDLKSIKSAISCIRFLLVNATRFQTDEITFSTELQQLGLPTEHSAAICRVYKEQSNLIQEYLTRNSLTGKFKLVQ